MADLLRRGDTVTASVVIAAPPSTVHAVVSEVTRIPEWSPECTRCTWVGPGRFRGSNRRRFGRWSTTCRVVDHEPDRTFAFVVEAMGGDFTRWSYQVAPGPYAGSTVLSEEVRMLVDLPKAAYLFERVFLRVRDRRADLRENLQASLDRIRTLVEDGSTIAAG